MASDPDPNGKLLEQLIGGHFTLSVFMLEISIEIARSKPHPSQWATDFISRLHARVDANEARIGEIARELSSHELARQNLDLLGRELLEELASP